MVDTVESMFARLGAYIAELEAENLELRERVSALSETRAMTVRVEIENDSELPSFGAYLAGTAPEGTAAIKINFTALFAAIADEGDEIASEDWKQIVSDTIVHELLHAFEDMLGKAFSEVRIEESIRRARLLDTSGDGHGGK